MKFLYNVSKIGSIVLILSLSEQLFCCHGFSLVMMVRGKGKGNLKRALSGESSSNKRDKGALPRQEITGVTLPADGTMKGWEFGDQQRMACANVNGRFYALTNECPKCAFDLWKGDLIVDDPGFAESPGLPCVACPTCATTYNLKNGVYGPPLKRTGLAGFVNGLAKTATTGDRPKDAEAYEITQDDAGKVYCRKLLPRRSMI
jgi:nitrite reductase/ring-hydroxylating ferredoxin subunit